MSKVASKVAESIKGAKDFVVGTAVDFYHERGRRPFVKAGFLGIMGYGFYKIGAFDQVSELVGEAQENLVATSVISVGAGGALAFSNKEMRTVRITENVQRTFTQKQARIAGSILAAAGTFYVGSQIYANTEDGNYVEAATQLIHGPSSVSGSRSGAVRPECLIPGVRAELDEQDIRAIQNQYLIKGLYGEDATPEIQVDGDYGPGSVAAEDSFQADLGMDPTQPWNAQTRDALFGC